MNRKTDKTAQKFIKDLEGRGTMKKIPKKVTKKKFMTFKKNLNKRVLWTYDNLYSKFGLEHLEKEIPDVTEGTITEFSPSKIYVKINKKWYDMNSIKIVEVLGDSFALSVGKSA